MNIIQVTPTQALPSTDFLFRADTYLIRARVEQITTEDEIRAAVERAVEQVNFKFSCSMAADESGDVKEDNLGRHIIFGAEVHSITLEDLAQGKSLEGWIAERISENVEKAARKAMFVTVIGSRYQVPAPPAEGDA